MAGDWIKIEHGLLGKPEVMLLADMLDISHYEAVGHLVAFWQWVDLNMSPECPQVKGTKKGLDRVAGRDGFADALVSVGWLEVQDGVVFIPGYEVHLSKSAKERAKGQKKKAMQRIKLSPNEGDKQGDKNGTKGGTREEKRREEDKVAKATSVPRPAKADPGPLADHGFTLSNGSLWRPTVSKVHEWQATFPVMDLDAQLRLAGQWLKDNPAKRKTERGMHRFLFAWLERAQNSNKALPLFQPNQQPKRPDPYGNCPRYS